MVQRIARRVRHDGQTCTSHQAVASAGPGGLVSAVAPDGVVEAVEYPAHRFALGVQWHPEYAVDPRDPAIFQAFVAAARG